MEDESEGQGGDRLTGEQKGDAGLGLPRPGLGAFLFSRLLSQTVLGLKVPPLGPHPAHRLVAEPMSQEARHQDDFSL